MAVRTSRATGSTNDLASQMQKSEALDTANRRSSALVKRILATKPSGTAASSDAERINAAPTSRQGRPGVVQRPAASQESRVLHAASEEKHVATVLNSLPLTPKSRQFLQCTLDRHILKQKEAEFLIAHLHDVVLRRQVSPSDSDSADTTSSSELSDANTTTNQVDVELTHKVLVIDWPLITVADGGGDDAGKYNEELSDKLFQRARDAFCHIVAQNNRLSTVALFHAVSMFRRFNTKATLSGSSTDDYAACYDEQYFRRVHLLLDACCLAVPLNADSVTVCLSQTHPYRTKPAAEHYCYNRNLLEFVERHPRYRLDVLSSIMQELTDIDHMLPAQSISRVEEKTTAQSLESLKMIQPLAETLNICMHLLFQFVSKLAEKAVTELREFFRQCFQPIFDAVFLRSHYVRHTQYLWFYLPSRDKVIRDQFLDKLWQKFTDPATPTVVRQCSVHYLCNFLARSSSVDNDIVLMWLIRLLKWCDAYVAEAAARKNSGISILRAVDNWASSSSNNNTGENNADNFSIHGVFFAAVHMSLYLLCFRSATLFAGAKSRAYILERAPLRRIVYSSLNPLRFCSPTVVDFFTEVCRHFHVMLLHPLIEENMRNASAEMLVKSTSMPDLCITAATVAEQRVKNDQVESFAGGGEEEAVEDESPTLKSKLSVTEWRLIRRVYPLVGFFAFEPYLLKRDRALIAKYYAVFSGLAGSGNDDQDSTGQIAEARSGVNEPESARKNYVVEAPKVVDTSSDRISNDNKIRQFAVPKSIAQNQRVEKRPLPEVSAEKLLALAGRRSAKKLKL